MNVVSDPKPRAGAVVYLAIYATCFLAGRGVFGHLTRAPAGVMPAMETALQCCRCNGCGRYSCEASQGVATVLTHSGNVTRDRVSL